MTGQRQLPDGEVTFLLTDIVGSTTLWERVPEAMFPAQARHDEIVLEVVTAHGGILIQAKGEGDSTFSVFDDPASAATAGFEVQRRLVKEPWPPEAPIRVRMSVHTGQVELRDGDYYGSTVNRAARLRSAGHGGQVLLSAATTNLVRSRLPEDASLRDLGTRRLKDLLEPEHIFQFVHPELPDSFPPLVTLDARPNNLPVQPTSFLGREELVARVTTTLRDPGTRLVTLTGPGGIGKTRLALRVAADLIDDFPDGVWFVPLAATDSSETVPTAIAAALGVTPDQEEDIKSALARHLQGRSVLLVLDNFEHVLDAADLVAALYSDCPGLNMLVTSREWLHLRAEREERVGPMDPSDATTLFVDRARAIGLDADLLDVDLVAQICRALDGLPLAIELVAARLRTFSLEELRTQLHEVLDLASDGPRDQPARQRTLRDTISWSIGLLSPAEREALLALSVFKGSWEPEGAAAVMGRDQEEASAVLVSLADRSLLTTTESGRYNMLETIRARASELSAEDPAVRERAQQGHLSYWSTRTSRAIEDFSELRKLLFDDTAPPFDAQSLAELDDLRAALKFGIAIGSENVAPVGLWGGALLLQLDHREAFEEFDATLASGVDDTWRYLLRLARLRALWGLGKWTDAEKEAGPLIEEAKVRYPEDVADMLNYKGICLWRLGRLEEADVVLKQAIQTAGPDQAKLCLLVHNRGLIALTSGDLRAAEALFEEAREIARREDRELVLIMGYRLADIALERGRADEAIDRAKEVMRSPELIPPVRGMAAETLVDALILKGQVKEAVAFAERFVVEASGWTGEPRVMAHMVQARSLLAADDALGAEAAAAAACALGAGTSQLGTQVDALRLLGAAKFQLGDLSGARRALTEGLGLDQTTGVGQFLTVSCVLAMIEEADGDVDRAWKRLAATLEASVQAGGKPRIADVCCYVADSAARSGDLPLAASLLGAATELRDQAGIELARPGMRGEVAEAALAEITADEIDVAAYRKEGRSLPLVELVSLVKAH